MNKYILMLIAMLFVTGCTDVNTYSGVDVCQNSDGTAECSEGHDESDNSETTTTEN